MLIAQAIMKIMSIAVPFFITLTTFQLVTYIHIIVLKNATPETSLTEVYGFVPLQEVIEKVPILYIIVLENALSFWEIDTSHIIHIISHNSKLTSIRKPKLSRDIGGRMVI